MHAIGFGPGLAVNRSGGGAAGFDFSGGVLPPRASLTRASSACLYDAGGTLVSVGTDVARFDHHPVSLAPLGVLIEPAGTNLVLASTDLTQSAWSRTALSVTATALAEDTQTVTHRFSPALINRSVTAGVPVTVSAIGAERPGSAKRYLTLNFTAAGFAAVPGATFDLASGTVVYSVNGSAGMRAAGSGAWLCWLTGTPTSTTVSQGERYGLNAVAGVPAGYAGDGASGLLLSEMQFETGAAPTSRIRTTSAAATRAADLLTLDWGSKGVADGAVTLRYSFDDGSTQDLAATVSGGVTAVPTNLARPWLLRVERV